MYQAVDSYYAASANTTLQTEALNDDLRCDVCIVGGGYTGLSTALHLAEAGHDVVLLEANTIAWGASGRNGGQVGSGQRKDQDFLEHRFGNDTARELWDMAEAAKCLVKTLIDKYQIHCDFKPGILHAGHNQAQALGLQKYAEKLSSTYAYDSIRPVAAQEITQMLGTQRYFGGSLDMGAAHLHPLNYALGLAQAAQKAGARLYENAQVLGYSQQSPTKIQLADFSVIADHLVLACNGYLGNLEKRLAGHIMPINNFILATEPLDQQIAQQLIRDDVAVADSKFVIDYFRLSADQRLLFGGGENYSAKFPRDLKMFVRKYMLRVYPQLQTTKIDYAWCGTLAVTLNRLPHFGRLPPNIYYAQGFSGHGIALASFAGKLMAEALSGTAANFDLFAKLPTPTFPGGTLLRWPALVLGMMYYSLRDRV